MGRNMLDLVDIVRFLEEHDIVIVSITDNIDTSSMLGRFSFYLVGAFAEMERENIISQAKNGMKKRAQEGLWNGCPAPIGYNNFKDGRGLIVNQKEAEIVKAIFDMYTNKR
ncbi:recombinase family protein [Clostridium sp. N3C]|uniref:recombinase family protein n=1 Tax=Clostridium sp. N3C TaxID=1776758 RepID=UPI00241C06E4|nr:recombinase family protein [Clostridium sp. N3C]